MTLDDAAAILDIGESSVKRLLREGKLAGWQRVGDVFARVFALGTARSPYADLKACPREVRRAVVGTWVVDGVSVRARRRLMNQPASRRNGLAVGRAAWK